MKLSLLVLLAAVSCIAALTVDPHYTVTDFVTGDGANYGVTFDPAGNFYSYNGCLHKYPATGGPFTFTNANQLSCPELGLSDMVATASGRLYLTQGSELSPTTGAVLRRAWTTTAVHGIALDPRDGAIIFSDYGAAKIYRVPNPDLTTGDNAVTPTVLIDLSTRNPPINVDGVTVGPDGTVYLAGYNTAQLVVAEGYGNPNQGQVRAAVTAPDNAVAGQGPDGISICGGDVNTYAITTRAGAQEVTRWNLTGPGGAPTYAATEIITGTGAYNDWSTVDPSGCVVFSASDGIVRRIGLAGGGCPCYSPQATAVANGDQCSANLVSAGSECTMVSASSSGKAVSVAVGMTVTGHCNFVNGNAV